MRDHPVDHRVLAEAPDLILGFLIDLDLFELFFRDLDGIAFKEDVKDRAFLSLYDPLHGPEDPLDDAPFPRGDLSRKVVREDNVNGLGLFASARFLQRSLN